jgi:hypothetical protein
VGRNQSKRDDVAGPLQSHTEDLLDEALTETFPASDPIAVHSAEDKSASTKNTAHSPSRGGKVSPKHNGDQGTETVK